MCFVFIWLQTATCATYSINWLVFITEMKSVYSAVRTGSLNKAVCDSSVKDYVAVAAWARGPQHGLLSSETWTWDLPNVEHMLASYSVRHGRAQTVTVEVTVTCQAVSWVQIVDRELPDYCLLPSPLLFCRFINGNEAMRTEAMMKFVF